MAHTDDEHNAEQDRPDDEPSRAATIAEHVARDLSGDLRCVCCGYNQRGLSVRAMCPECGEPVLATVLGVIDPHAEQLRAIPAPRLVAGGLICWAGFALLAAILTWVIHVSMAAGLEPGRWTARVSVWLLVASGVSAVVLVRPHAGLGKRRIVGAVVAVALYVPLVMLHRWLVLPLIGADKSPFLSMSDTSPGRHGLRLCGLATMVAIMLLLRPAARMLAGRSLVVRTGRVDRQSMYALAGALGLAGAGDLLALGAGLSSEILRGTLLPIAHILIAMGSLLFTLGLGGILIDSIRLAPVILHKPPSVEKIFGEREGMFEP